MRKSTKAGRFLGIDVYLHWTFWLIFTWIMFAFTYMFSSPVIGLPLILQVFFIFLAVFLLFTSLLCHEYAHCLVARHCGVGTKRITMIGCGVVASLDFDKVYEKGPGTEFKIAVAGPLTSLFLAVLFFGAYTLFLSWVPQKFTLMDANLYNPVGVIFYVLIRLNIILAFFNFLPAFPMDGGRLLRSFLWWLRKDLLWATKIACFVGKITVFTAFPAIGFFIIGTLFSVVFLVGMGILLLIPAGNAEYDLVKKRSNK